MSKRLPGDRRQLAAARSIARLKYYLLLTGLLGLAFALRLIAIDQIPAGLSHDEAYNGIAALQVLDGDRPIFFEINKGIEPLIIYLEAVAFYFFGIGPVQLRLVNVFAGMLTVALIHPLAARLFNRRVALLAVAGVTVSFWALFVSRLTLRAVLLPPLVLLLLYLFWRALHEKGSARSLLYFGLSGLAGGVTMYTYLSSRFVPFILLTLFGYQVICRWTRRKHWLGLLLCFVIWGGLFVPLAAYFWENADSFTRRSGQVTNLPQALAGDFAPLLRNTGRTLAMFTVAGDTTGRYNLDGRPLFDGVNGFCFYLGLGWLLWRLLRQPQAAPSAVLLLSAIFFMLLPDFITDDSPHFLRTIGALPMIYILWAMGLNLTAGWLHRRAGRWPALVALVGLPLLAGLHTGYDYFVRWNQSPDARYIYGADIAEVARYLDTAGSDDLAAISAEYYRDLDRFRLALHFGADPPFALWFDGRQSLAFPPPGSRLSPRYIFPDSAKPPELWTRLLNRSAPESGREYDLYRLPEESPLPRLQAEMTPVDVTFNDAVSLLGYQILNRVETGGQLQVLLIWQALRTLPPGTDYTFLLQLHDNQGHRWLQIDGNGYDPGDWQPGLIGLQLLTFHLPADLPPRSFQLSAQVLDRRSGQPLPATDGQTVVPLGAVSVHLAGNPDQPVLERIPNYRADAAPIGITGLRLRGHDLSDDTLAPGDALLLTLYWQVAAPPPRDYHVQLLLAQNGQPVYRWPSLQPAGGEWPTSNWLPNSWLRDKFTLPLPPNLPPGRYDFQGTWVPKTGPNSPEFDIQPIEIRLQ